MAKQVILERDGIAKPSYVGFSWTIFFFGAWVPLIRGRYLDALVSLFYSWSRRFYF